MIYSKEKYGEIWASSALLTLFIVLSCLYKIVKQLTDKSSLCSQAYSRSWTIFVPLSRIQTIVVFITKVMILFTLSTLTIKYVLTFFFIITEVLKMTLYTIQYYLKVVKC